jgi:hypothetical protein
MKHLARFDLANISYEWVHYVDWNVLPKELKNRLRMFIAGYRMPYAIKSLARPKSKDNDAWKNFDWLMALLDKDPVWALCSPTRDTSGVSFFKDFNHECAASIWAWYSLAEIDFIIKQPVLYARRPNKQQFSAWQEWYKRDLDSIGPGSSTLRATARPLLQAYEVSSSSNETM